MPRSDLIMEARRALVNQRERRLRAGWRLLVGLFLFAFVAFVAGTIQSVVAAMTLQSVVFGGLVTLVGWWLLYGLMTGGLVGLSWLVDARTVEGLGLGGPDWWRNLAFGLALGVVMTTTVFVVELALGFIAIEGTLVARDGSPFDVGLSAVSALPLVFLFFVAVGVFEEVLNRGYLFNNIAEGLDGLGPIGPRGAIATAAVVTSIIFGVLHTGNPGTTPVAAFNITVVGLFLAATYVLTNDLGIAIGVHVTWNFSLSSLYGFPVSGLTSPATVLSVRQTGPELVTGGDFGPEGGLVVYLALAVAVGLTYWWVQREEGSVRFRTDTADPDLRKPRRPE